MSLWEGLSGQIYHWNNTKQKTKFENLIEVRIYLQRQLEEGPAELAVEYKTMSRNVYTYYAACEHVVCSLLDSDLKPLRKRFFALNSQGLRYFFCAFAIHHVLQKYWVNQGHSNYWTEVAVMNCNMYGIKGFSVDHYLGNWYQCFNGLDEITPPQEVDGVYAVRIAHKRYELISNLLGLPNDDKNTIFSGFFWGPIATQFAHSTSTLLGLSEWKDELDQVLPL